MVPFSKYTLLLLDSEVVVLPACFHSISVNEQPKAEQLYVSKTANFDRFFR